MERIIRDFLCWFLVKLQALIFYRSSGVKPPIQQWVYKTFNRLIRWTMGEEEYFLSIARGLEKLQAEYPDNECLEDKYLRTAKSD